MKNFLQSLKIQLQNFIENHPKPAEINLKANKILTTIQQAQDKKLALHVIYADKYFTGDLVKYDKEAGKLILKNFQQNISAIISIADIDHVSLVPPTVRQSQLQNKEK